MKIRFVTFRALHWVDTEVAALRDDGYISWPRLSGMQEPVARFLADELRNRGLEVGKPWWTFKGCVHFVDVQVDERHLLFSVGWMKEGKMWEVGLYSEQILKMSWQSIFIKEPEHQLEKLEHLINEILQNEPQISQINWQTEIID